MSSSRRLPLLMVIIVLVFALAFGAVVIAVSQAGNAQRQIRVAQGARATLLRLQLDEETGMRGYTSTGQRVFLDPYNQAAAKFATSLEAVRNAVVHIAAPKAVQGIADLGVTHQRWLSEVAAPLIADPKRSNALTLQLQGKILFDRLRDDNDAVFRALDDAGGAADASLRQLVYTIVAIGAGFGMGLLGLLFWIAKRQRKLEMQLSGRHQLEEQVERQRLLLDREREIAKSLQDALLARDLPRVPGLSIHARYRPAGEIGRVGGDWYDAFALADGRIFITLGDVTGHGVTATATMSRVRHAILAAALHQSDPATILRIANRGFGTTYSEPVVGTVVCAFIDPATREIIYATAGHPPPVLVSPDTGAEFLQHGGTPLGVDDCDFRTHVAHAIGNALLVFYTDGLTEATGDILEGEARLLEAAQWVAGADVEDPALALKQRMLGDASPLDDIAILTVSFTMNLSATLPVELNALARQGVIGGEASP